MSGDDKLPLKFQREAFDPANEIALFWVKVPRIMAGAKQDFIWIYYGNKNAPDGQDRGGVYDVNQVAVYHLDEDQGKPQDETAYGNQPSEFSSGMGTPAVIGAGISLNGSSDRIVIPRSSSLNFSTGFTFSAWIRMFGPQQNTRILSWEDQNQSLVIEVDQTKIFAKAVAGGQAFETPKTTDLPLESWHLLAVTAEPSKRLAIYIDGAETASVNLPGPLPEPAADICIGASLKGNGFFSGDLDEIELSRTARSAEWLRAAFKGQGPDNVLASVTEEESVAATGESLTIHLLKVVARTITLDGWLVIGILAILGAFCWVIFLTKSLSLRQINRENNAFSQEFNEAPAFDTLYHGENNEFSGSSLYRIYNAGFEEMKLTQSKTEKEKNGISKSALKSIESALDKATMRESRQLGTGLMVLTFGISGGPFLGLFGTVWGVMNTFAGMAEAGEATSPPSRRRRLRACLYPVRSARGDPGAFFILIRYATHQGHQCRYVSVCKRVRRQDRGRGTMKKNPYGEHEVIDEINVVPLLDLAWNLRLVFMIVVTASVQGINVNLPKASAATSSVKPTTKAITITGEGKIYLDTFEVTMADLETRLRQYKAVDPNPPVVIKGDEKISYKSVIEVLDLLQRLEITQLGLVTQKLVK